MSYSDEIKRSSIAENWLFILNNDNSGALRFAFSDTLSFASNNWEDYNAQWDSETDTWDTAEDEQFFYGVILNKPTIRESINLSNSTSKSSNISITIPDFNYQGSPISEELFGGTNHYINQSVTVYSLINSQTNQIGSFRLTDISSNGDKISLSMVTEMPWDIIETPNVLSPNKNYAPVSYGAFTKLSGINFYQNLTGGSFRPSQYDSQSDTLSRLYYVSGVRSSTGDAQPSLYSKAYDTFIPYRGGSTDTNTLTDVEAVHIQSNGRYSFYAGAISQSTTSTDADITVANLTKTYDYNLTNAGTFDYDKTALVIEDNKNIYDFNFTKTTSGAKLALKYSIDIDVIEHGSMYVKIDLDSDGGNITTGNKVASVSTTTAYVTLDAEIESATLTINFHHAAGVSPVRLDSTVTIHEAYIDYDIFQDVEIDEVYIGIDGDDKGWTAGTVTEIQEAHRSLLHTYTNLDVATTPDGWSALDTARSGWNIRWWMNQPEELKKSLERLQYEGCFISRIKADGSLQYIFIPDSPVTDETLTKLDMKDITVRPSSFSELLTKMEVSYEKHPAENRYLSSRTEQSSTSRTNWNIQSKENVKQIKLDALVSNTGGDFDDDPNDGFTAYYGNIFGDIKMIISATIVNPVYYTLEVGKILAFSDMYPVKAFNTSWSGLQFMITSLSRTPGTMKFTAREL